MQIDLLAVLLNETLSKLAKCIEKKEEVSGVAYCTNIDRASIHCEVFIDGQGRVCNEKESKAKISLHASMP